MRSAAVKARAADLPWSLWTELGVNGVVRNHSWTAVDPEPLVVATPRIGESDARLVEEAGRWCANHAARLSVSRIEGLLESSTQSTRVSFLQFAQSLSAHAAVKWPIEKWWTTFADPAASRPATSTRASTRTRHLSARTMTVPLDRPALFRLRMRALVGVGARSDVLTELVGRASTWTSASDLQPLGYSKRNVARVLAELNEAGVAQMKRSGGAFRYRLGNAAQLAQVVAPVPEAFPPWHDVFHHVIATLDLVESAEKKSVSGRVASAVLHDALSQTSTALWLDPPPPIIGERTVPGRVIDWAHEQLSALASGESRALRGLAVDEVWVAGARRAEDESTTRSQPHARKSSRSRTP